VDKVILTSGKISLETPLEIDNASELSTLANDESIGKTIGIRAFPYPYTIDDAESFITKNREDNGKPFIIDWFIAFEGKKVGIIGLSNIDYENKSAHIGYWINSQYRKRGIATSALGLVVEYSKKTMNLHRLYTKVMHNNPSSMRVLLKCGFSIEGIERDSLLLNGTYFDMLNFGITFRN
jgi:RimJ/RimL family protein N-acetyltransferase